MGIGPARRDPATGSRSASAGPAAAPKKEHALHGGHHTPIR
ncbi:hypothetical protein GJR88_00643 [Dietzia sp. DQ12-45-1b]|nr:hypothetical protein GJR88_00643 [Dietzia sp. DQ12-45-1b]